MKYLIALISFILLLACTKVGKNMTIKGRAVNPVTGEGIPGARVFLSRSKLDIGSATKIVKETTTDENGSFEISKLSLYHCELRCDPSIAGDYYLIGWEKKKDVPLFDAFTISVKKGKTMHADYYAVPYGKLNLNVKNISCLNSSDNLKLYFDGGPFDAGTFSIGLMTTLDGCIDIPGIPIKSSMGFKYFHWEVTKNNITTTYYDTIFVNANQITEYDVNY